MSIGMQITVVVVAIPYFFAWWLTLRIVFGKRFQPLEWIPLAILSLGVPAVLQEFIHDEALGNWLAGAWAALPAPMLLGGGLMRRLRKERLKRPADPCNPVGCLPMTGI